MFDYLETSYNEPINFEAESDASIKRDNDIPMKPGEKLPNGAIILAETVIRKFEHRRDSIVLCVTTGWQPFVTWVRVIRSDIPEYNSSGDPTSWFNVKDFCESGLYSYDLDKAITAYNDRCAKYTKV